MAGLEDTLYDDHGLNNKPKANMNDYFFIDFEKVDYLNIIHNTTKFREINGIPKIKLYG